MIRKTHAATLILLSYLAAVTIGTGLLLLPFSTVSGNITVIDALFTATSAVCVTGLIVVDTGTYFTFFGQLIILMLLQLGGLGIMTISVAVFHSIGKKVSFKQRMILQESFSHVPREDIYRLVKAIFYFTAIMELCGAILLFIHWSKEYPLLQAGYLAVFHSVSAFCNAGFSLLENSFMQYRDALLLNFTVCVLIIFGGIGFPVVYEIYNRPFEKKTQRSRLSVQTKSVLITTFILIFCGTAIFIWVEHGKTLRAYSTFESMITAFFQSVTCRTAGFNTVEFATLSNATLALMIFLMFIGASPGSCGGGIKTTTLAILSVFTWSRTRGKLRVNMFRKSIPREIVTKSISIVVLSISLIAIVLFLLLLSQPNQPVDIAGNEQFLEYLFEVVSAFATVGLSMGATAQINVFGKFLIIVMMLIGRVGILTFSYIIAGPEGRNGIEYAEESIMVG
ncbi:MAG: ATPase [Desulfobacterales bacterium]|nr:ATPase [Desulfobacterales bacterium]